MLNTLIEQLVTSDADKERGARLVHVLLTTTIVKDTRQYNNFFGVSQRTHASYNYNEASYV
ncbi:hypothetical protein BaRGS_00036267, partial [Batillaria attramentaria]